MERIRRVWQPEIFYHVTMRGNNHQIIFQTQEDFTFFFRILQYIHSQLPFTVIAYCLMNNHYHLLIRSTKVPLSKVVELINIRYAEYFKRKYGVCGQIYETHYFASMVSDPISLLNMSSYIHQIPIKTSGLIADKMENYTYSSYQHYIDSSTSPYPFFDNKILTALVESYPELNVNDYSSYCENFQQEKENPPFAMTPT